MTFSRLGEASEMDSVRSPSIHEGRCEESTLSQNVCCIYRVVWLLLEKVRSGEMETGSKKSKVQVQVRGKLIVEKNNLKL